MRKRTFAGIVAAAILSAAASALAANNPPLSSAWNIAPSGKAASSGELLFRMTPGNTDEDPVEVTVSVMSGTSDIGVARDIRRALSSQLRAERFTVELGQGANVLVTDARGEPNFSLELMDSDVENVRVVVQSVTPAASPTVQEQSTPAVAPALPTPPAPGDALPPASSAPPANTAPPSNASQPAAPPPNATPGGAPASAPPPANSPALPNPSPPPSSSPAGAPAGTPPPTR